jgi:dTDP-4-amino-4,6-dideoxygalactose transaminase
VEFLDLSRQTAGLRGELSEAVGEVLDSGRFLLGERVAEFETAVAGMCGAAHGIGTSSGLDALTIALRACAIGPDDEVIAPAFGPVPTVAAILATGAEPVLCDVDAVTLTLDPDRLAEATTARTRAVVPVHLYGQCADMEGVMRFARDRDLIVVEDVAQAIGASFGGRPAGSIGDAAAFSFYPTKNLGAAGDAGAIVTDDATVAERSRRLRALGTDRDGRSVERALHSRLDEIQAAILLTKLPHLGGWTERRRAIARRYQAGLVDTGLTLPVESVGREHVFHLFVVRSPDREALRRRLHEQGIQTLIHYPLAVHQHPAYRDLIGRGSLAVSERGAAEVLSLPLYPELTPSEVETVVEGVCRATVASAR